MTVQTPVLNSARQSNEDPNRIVCYESFDCNAHCNKTIGGTSEVKKSGIQSQCMRCALPGMDVNHAGGACLCSASPSDWIEEAFLAIWRDGLRCSERSIELDGERCVLGDRSGY